MKAIKLLPVIVLGLVIAGMVTVAGVKIIANFRSQIVDDLDATTETNDIVTAVTTTILPSQVSAGGILNSLSTICVGAVGDVCESVAVGTDANASTGYHGTGVITINSNLSGNRSNLTYSWLGKDAILNATEGAMDGTTEIANQFGTIGIVAAMVVVLMMIGGLTAYFGLR